MKLILVFKQAIIVFEISSELLSELSSLTK